METTEQRRTRVTEATKRRIAEVMIQYRNLDCTVDEYFARCRENAEADRNGTERPWK